MFAGARGTASGQRIASEMPDNARMTIASRCHQHPVHHVPAIIRRSHPPRARSSYHSLPARSNSPRQGPSRGSVRPQKRHRARHARPGTAAAPANRCADASDIFRRRAEPLHQRLRAGHAGEIEIVARVACTLLVVARGALPARGEEEFVAGRRENRGQHGRSVLHQRHADAPVVAAGEIGARAVDGIDDPGLASCRAAPRRRRFLPTASRNPASPRAAAAPADR